MRAHSGKAMIQHDLIKVVGPQRAALADRPLHNRWTIAPVGS